SKAGVGTGAGAGGTSEGRGEAFAKRLALVGTGGGIVTGLGAFLFNSVAGVNAARRGFQKPDFDRQITRYFETAEIASTLATSLDHQERDQATARFWRLYWGKMGMVEDAQVEMKMAAFGQELKGLRVRPEDVDDLIRLQIKAFELIQALRHSLS